MIFFFCKRGIVLTLIVGLMGVLFAGCSTPSTPAPTPQSSIKDRETEQFTRGMRSFQSGHYREAETHFKNVIASFPGSPLLMETQWYLGRSYMATGETDLALREFDLLVKNYSESSYGRQARRLLSKMDVRFNKVVAVTWSPEETPRLNDRLRQIHSSTVNTVILTLPNKQLEKMSSSPEKPVASDAFNEWIRAAREEKLRVFVKIPLSALSIASAGNLHYGQEGRSSRGDLEKKLDLFHPDVRPLLIQLCRNIAQYPLDGIYVDSIGYRMDEGETISARILYENLFLEKLPNTRQASPSSPLWRFAGLKSRYMATLLHEMRRTAQTVNPPIVFGISVPEMLLMDPRDGLVQSSLDYVQLKAAQFDFYVITERRASEETIYAALRKYDALDRTWLESRDPQHWSQTLSEVPIQGVLISSR